MRRRDAVLAVQRLLAVAETVVVLDVVVDQRRLVERLDRHGRASHGVGEAGHVRRAVRPRCPAAGQGVVDGQRDERPRVLAALGQEVVGDRFGGRDGIQRRQPLPIDFRQPRAATLSRPPSGPARPARTAAPPPASGGCTCASAAPAGAAGHWIISSHPILVDRRVAAVARQQRHGHAGDAGQQDLVDRLLQHVQAGHAQNGVHVAADDDLHHDRRAFGHQHPVAQSLRRASGNRRCCRPRTARNPGRTRRIRPGSLRRASGSAAATANAGQAARLPPVRARIPRPRQPSSSRRSLRAAPVPAVCSA